MFVENDDQNTHYVCSSASQERLHLLELHFIVSGFLNLWATPIHVTVLQKICYKNQNSTHYF